MIYGSAFCLVFFLLWARDCLVDFKNVDNTDACNSRVLYFPKGFKLLYHFWQYLIMNIFNALSLCMRGSFCKVPLSYLIQG